MPNGPTSDEPMSRTQRDELVQRLRLVASGEWECSREIAEAAANEIEHPTKKLAGTAEFVVALSVTRPRITQLRRLDPLFPPLVDRLTMGLIFYRDDIELYAKVRQEAAEERRRAARGGERG